MSRNTVFTAAGEGEGLIEPSVRRRGVGGGDVKAEMNEIKQSGPFPPLEEPVNREPRGNPLSVPRSMPTSTAKLAEDLLAKVSR
jgi:hypothetical protein